MTFYVRKRGKTYRLEGRHGERLHRGTGERERLRLALGTLNAEAAQKLLGRIERALADGPGSVLWAELRSVLPPETFNKLAAIAGYDGEKPQNAPRYCWQDLESKFTTWMTQRVALGKLRDSTKARYTQTVNSFREFVTNRKISDLTEINRAVVEDFKAWRLTRVLEKKFSRGGRGIVLDAAILAILGFCFRN